MDVSKDAYHKKYIPDQDNVFRNVSIAERNRWKAKRRPNEADFTLKENEDGLSVNWEHFCNLNKV